MIFRAERWTELISGILIERQKSRCYRADKTIYPARYSARLNFRDFSHLSLSRHSFEPSSSPREIPWKSKIGKLERLMTLFLLTIFEYKIFYFSSKDNKIWSERQIRNNMLDSKNNNYIVSKKMKYLNIFFHTHTYIYIYTYSRTERLSLRKVMQFYRIIVERKRRAIN